METPRVAGNHRRHAAAAGAYLLATAAIFHNLLPVMSTSIYSATTDPLLNASILDWNATHMPLTQSWWNYPAFAPLPGVTAWTEHLLGAYPLTTPIVWITGNPVLAYGVLLVGCFVLNGLAMFALAREVTQSDAGAFVAGVAFAFAPYHASQVAHVQMLMGFGMPLALLGLHQYVAHGRRAGIGWFALGWLAVALSNAYLLVFFPVLAALWCAWFARGRVTRLVPIAIAGAGVMMATAPLFWGYHVRQAAYGFARGYDEIRSFGADVRSVLNVTHQNIVWRNWLNTTAIETALFPGAAIVILAWAGVAPRLRGAWRRRDPIVFYAAGALAMWLLALGPEPTLAGKRIVPYGPYRLLLLLPGSSSIRVPARAFELTVLCLAVTAGAGAAVLMQRRRWRPIGVALALAVLAEGWFADVAAAVPEPLPAGTVPAGSLVMDTPLGATNDNVPAEYFAVMSGYRVINGYSGYAPAYFASLREAMAQHRDEAFDAFRRYQDLYVIIRPIVDAPFIRWLETQKGVETTATSPAWRVYRLPRIDGPVPLPLPLGSPGPQF
jgi:hypothetical protein